MKPLILAALAVVLQAPGTAIPLRGVADTKCFHDGSTVNLTGTVTRRMFYGPPNYGETPKTDRRVRVAILRLESPITPCDLDEFDRKGHKSGELVREVQIDAWPAKFRSGERRTLVGTIHGAMIAPDYLDYVLNVP